MSVGAAAGLAAGLALMGMDRNELIYAEGPSIGIVTDKSDYGRGESVHIRVVNTGTVQLESPNMWDIRVSGLSGMLMYSDAGAGGSTLAPGADYVLVWNQTQNDGDAILEGVYRISARGAAVTGEAVHDWVTISVWK